MTETKSELDQLAEEAEKAIAKNPKAPDEAPEIHTVELPTGNEDKDSEEEAPLRKRKRAKRKIERTEKEDEEERLSREHKSSKRATRVSRSRRGRKRSFFSDFFDW
jgi:hypothetical protein